MNTPDRKQTPADMLNEIESRPVPPSQLEFRAILGDRIIQSKDGWCIRTTSPTSCRMTRCNGSSSRCPEVLPIGATPRTILSTSGISA